MTKTYKTTSRSALARELLTKGFPPKAVAKRTGLSIQTIYTVKWKMANKQGLGAIKPQTPAVGQRTGIASVPPEFATTIDRTKKKSNNRRNAQLKRWARERAERERNTMTEIIATLQPKPTLWQKIKAFFVGA